MMCVLIGQTWQLCVEEIWGRQYKERGVGVQQSNSSTKEGNLHFHSSSLSSFLKRHTCWLDTYMYVTRMPTGALSNVKWTQLILIICYLLRMRTPIGTTNVGKDRGPVVCARNTFFHASWLNPDSRFKIQLEQIFKYTSQKLNAPPTAAFLTHIVFKVLYHLNPFSITFTPWMPDAHSKCSLSPTYHLSSNKNVQTYSGPAWGCSINSLCSTTGICAYNSAYDNSRQSDIFRSIFVKCQVNSAHADQICGTRNGNKTCSWDKDVDPQAKKCCLTVQTVKKVGSRERKEP